MGALLVFSCSCNELITRNVAAPNNRNVLFYSSTGQKFNTGLGAKINMSAGLRSFWKL